MSNNTLDSGLSLGTVKVPQTLLAELENGLRKHKEARKRSLSIDEVVSEAIEDWINENSPRKFWQRARGYSVKLIIFLVVSLPFNWILIEPLRTGEWREPLHRADDSMAHFVEEIPSSKWLRYYEAKKKEQIQEQLVLFSLYPRDRWPQPTVDEIGASSVAFAKTLPLMWRSLFFKITVISAIGLTFLLSIALGRNPFGIIFMIAFLAASSGVMFWILFLLAHFCISVLLILEKVFNGIIATITFICSYSITASLLLAFVEERKDLVVETVHSILRGIQKGVLVLLWGKRRGGVPARKGRSQTQSRKKAVRK